LKYRGQYKEYPVDKMLHERYFAEKKNGFCIECGALNGFYFSSCWFFEEYMDWSCVNIEPHPDSYKDLVENRPNSFLNLNMALGAQNGKGELVYSIKKNRLKLATLRNKPLQRHHRKVTVDVITYKTLISKHNIDLVDLFVLDVEGTEVEVIEGMRDTDVLPNIFCVEIHRNEEKRRG
jgi:FkbM family methyltransferase